MRYDLTSYRTLAALPLVLLALSAGCARPAPATGPGGVVTVGLSTSGAGGSALSFAVAIDGPASAARPPQSGRIKADGGIVTFRALAEGSYTVRLSVPSQCRVDGGSDRRIAVAARRTTAVRFTARCT